MSDTVTINTVNEDGEGNASVDVTISISGVHYDQTIPCVDNAVSIVQNVKDQAEAFKAQVLATQESVPDAQDPQSVVGEVINL